MPEAVIIEAKRSPIGRANKGALAEVRPDDLLAHVMRLLVESVGLDPSLIEDVYTGCGFPNGEQGMNVSRISTLLAGFPETVPGATVNRFCASSLQTIRMAQHAIVAGEGDVFLACGVESTSRVDRLPEGIEALNPIFLADDKPWDVYLSMGMTAENVAERYGVTREEMDKFAQQSQMRAVAAVERGFFDRDIIEVKTPSGAVVNKDDGPRASSTIEKLSELKPVFKDDGLITAGNACPLNDGAAAVLVMSAQRAKAEGLTPRARIVASAVSALDPAFMGVGPIEAVKRVLARANMTIENVDVVELNEAFAAQVIPVCREIGVDPFSDKLNPNGGAIALGHPFGMTGARIMATLLNDLEDSDKTIGLETMCVGGGQGMAMIVERI